MLAFVGCVKGNPIEIGSGAQDGGTIAIANCGYSITTRLGAEAPTLAVDAFGDDATPRLVHLGFVGDPKTSMVAQWRTADEVTRAGLVRYAKGANLTAEELTETAPGIQFAYESTGGESPRMHQAHMCGLEPGTTYSYQVGAHDPVSGASSFSPVYSFRTAPDIVAHPDTEVVIGSLGDCRNGYDIWEQLTTRVKTYDPDLVVFTGDAVTIGITQYEWEAFLGRAEPLFATVPVVFAHGNHEVNAVNFFSQFAQPGDQENFGVDYGHVHLTVLNDTPAEVADLTGKTVAFLRADLEASKAATWKLAMHHQPVWSSATAHGSNLTLQQAWQPLYDQYKVDLVLNGHDHDFELSKPMVGQSTQSSVDKGTVYLVQGGAGAELYDNASQFFTQYAEKTYGASVLHVRANQLTLDAFRPDGSTIPAGFTKSK
ncbi:MAG: metallophosphoesterase family protein [Proteobacteria bacterium]|nr:metallophosphoesterase family protein [Pseudomonadota bacterium]